MRIKINQARLFPKSDMNKNKVINNGREKRIHLSNVYSLFISNTLEERLNETLKYIQMTDCRKKNGKWGWI